MNIKIDISVCRVCLQPGHGTNIYTGDILEKFVYTTLVQVSAPRILLLLNRILFDQKEKTAEKKTKHLFIISCINSVTLTGGQTRWFIGNYL